jgi:hypothetical protein
MGIVFQQQTCSILFKTVESITLSTLFALKIESHWVMKLSDNFSPFCSCPLAITLSVQGKDCNYRVSYQVVNIQPASFAPG